MKTGWLIALGILSLTGLAPARAGEVQVLFTVGSASFKANLKQSAGDVETSMATELADQLRQCFPPLDWVTTPQANPSDAVLTATLVEDKAVPPNYSIAWSAKVGATDLPLDSPPIELPVYGPSDFQIPLRNAPRLIGDLQTKLRNWCAGEVMKARLHDQFIKNVPLAKQVTLDTTGRAVLIPLLWQRAKLDGQSVFRLEFLRAGTQSRMRVLLTGVGERREQASPSITQISVVESCDASGAPVSGDMWATCILLLDQQDPPPEFISFEKYVPRKFEPGLTSTGTSVTP